MILSRKTKNQRVRFVVPEGVGFGERLFVFGIAVDKPSALGQVENSSGTIEQKVCEHHVAVFRRRNTVVVRVFVIGNFETQNSELVFVPFCKFGLEVIIADYFENQISFVICRGLNIWGGLVIRP